MKVNNFEELKKQLLNFSVDCREKYIPAIRPQTADILCDIVVKKQPHKILEIGTAGGCSGALMLFANTNAFLTTIDINKDMCKLAEQTFAKYELSGRVKIENADALEYLKNCKESFDFVFVDGPKGQYIKYWDYLKKLISKGGTIFCDDVLYFGMVLDDSKVIHKKITIVRNLREFINITKNDAEFESKLLDIEDGILILEKKL